MIPLEHSATAGCNGPPLVPFVFCRLGGGCHGLVSAPSIIRFQRTPVCAPKSRLLRPKRLPGASGGAFPVGVHRPQLQVIGEERPQFLLRRCQPGKWETSIMVVSGLTGVPYGCCCKGNSSV